MFEIFALVVTASSFTLMGLVAIAAPERVTSQFGIAQLDVDGRNEVRAVYGGFGLAVASALIFSILNPQLRAGVGGAVSLALIGLACGRLASAVIDRQMGRFPRLYCAIELVGAALMLTVSLD